MAKFMKKKPVPERVMLDGKHGGANSICQTLRNMYLKTDDEYMKYNLRLVMAMAKSMNRRLKDNKIKIEKYEEELNVIQKA